MADSPSAVLIDIGTRLTQPEPTAAEGAVVICGHCSARYFGADIGKFECDKCGANLLTSAMYMGGACPYAEDCTIPYGFCHCGCGNKTGGYSKTDIDRGRFRGAKARYVHGHNNGVGAALTGKPSHYGRSVVAEVSAALARRPNRPVMRSDLVKELGLTPKQVSTAMSTLKQRDARFTGEQGCYQYLPNGPHVDPNTHIARILVALSAEPGVKFSRAQLADKCGLTPQQVSNAMTYGKLTPDVHADGHGFYWYGDRPSALGLRQNPAGVHTGVQLSLEARQLLTALEKAADRNGVITASTMDAVRRANLTKYFKSNKMKPETMARRALGELHDAGYVNASSNRVKRLLKKWDGTPITSGDEPGDGSLTSEPTTQVRAAFTPDEIAAWADSGITIPQAPPTPRPDPLAAVDPKDLADAIARSMWERYEWALAEVGRLQDESAMLETRLQQLANENKLLKQLLQAIPASTVEDVARRFMVDASD